MFFPSLVRTKMASVIHIGYLLSVRYRDDVILHDQPGSKDWQQPMVSLHDLMELHVRRFLLGVLIH